MLTEYACNILQGIEMLSLGSFKTGAILLVREFILLINMESFFFLIKDSDDIMVENCSLDCLCMIYSGSFSRQ